MGLRVQRTQHAVGQGGFHSAEIQSGRKRFRYIYDCGSKSKAKLADVVDAWGSADREYDWLVISSFDSDHFNGVKYLIDNKFTFRQIVLPHKLSQEFFTWHLLSSLVAGQSVAEILEIWAFFVILLIRGVGPVIPFGGEGQNINDQEGLVDLDAFAAASADEITKRWVGIRDSDWMFRFYSRELSYPDLVAKIFATPRLETLELLVEGAAVALIRNNALLNNADWLTLIQTELNQKVTDVNGNFRTVKQILSAAFAAVRRADGSGFNDYNSASLCLYSGPVPELSEVTSCKFELYRYKGGSWLAPKLPVIESSRSVGWLGVGDITFKASHELNEFLEYYSDELRYVVTRMIPHHGAKSNYDAALQNLRGFVEAAPLNGVIWVAAADPISGGYGHPAGVVVQACSTTGVVWITSADSGTKLVELVVSNCCCCDNICDCECC